ncbi:uncharacterized protein LOC103719104 [Phoenix dactylifera]|uniref:Uncharacterized protein LOC103719104 n=1 Tax=Phoenix dactylifera TaxID=42345 RepID=A0A8B7CU26_PHODC|nr:uncharacterized protein LOC103719104 [Phoenix dactylifera]
MRSAAGSCTPAILSSKTLTPAHASDVPPPRKLHRRRRTRKRILPGASTGARSRRDGSASGGRRSRPATPLLRWKFDDADRSAEPPSEFLGGKARRKHRNAAGEGAPAVSARKLAAGLWQLQLPEASGGVGERRGAPLGFEPNFGQLHVPYGCDPNVTGFNTNTKNELSTPISVQDAKNDTVPKLEASAALSNCAMERATKWDHGCSKTSDEVYRFYGNLMLLEDQQVTTVSVVSALQAALEQARSHIIELEAEKRSAKKKLDHFLRKLAEEKASWRKREHEKIRAVMDAMKDDLNRERKNGQRMEIMNSKLVNELAEAKLSAKRYLQDYEKERKAREIMEEVCDELAKEIGEDKAEIEALKRESMKIREEVEEERRMLQMAEVWREERVQMKLVDAKLTLEEKYSQLSKLQKDLDAFLRKQSGTYPDMAELKEAEMLREAANSVKVQDIKVFSYQPPASEDIFSVFEELLPREETNERAIEQCFGNSPASRASNIHTVSPETDAFLEKPTKRYANGIIEGNGDIEDDSGWETVSHVEELGSSNSPEGSDPSVNGKYRESNASVSGTDWDENRDNGKLSSEISEVCSATTRQSRKKASSISRLWRSSCPNNSENYKKISFEVTNGRLSNGRKSNATLSPDRKSGEEGLSSPSVGQWSSPDSLNPHITRGLKGCIEWPRGMQKHSLKAKLLEARMESQKVQLRHVLRQKI